MPDRDLVFILWPTSIRLEKTTKGSPTADVAAALIRNNPGVFLLGSIQAGSMSFSFADGD